MKLIKPSVEFWSQPETWQEQVARAAHLCYGRDTSERSAIDVCDGLASRGHNSMFRHGSAYFYLSYVGKERMIGWLYTKLTSSPFVGLLYRAKKNAQGEYVHHYYISTNMQYIYDNPTVYKQLMAYEVSLRQFIVKAMENGFPKALNLLRYTVCVTTQIGTSRELNRTSPNAIAEQSTRYVNFGKRGGVAFVLPYWWDSVSWHKRLLAKLGWKASEFFYNLWLRIGFTPEAARNFLMLEAGTRVAYTYNVYEWKHIMALRLTGATGKPHPDAKIAAQLIYDAILPAMRSIDSNADLMPIEDSSKKS